MRFAVLILFPDMIRQGLSTSIFGRTEERDLISFSIRNVHDYTTEWHGHTDDTPYGGGAGMPVQADPIFCCYRNATTDLPKAPRVIYITPQGRRSMQVDAKMFAAERTLLILCGHYEGVDERAPKLLGVKPYSIGDYALTGGELPAMVVVDAISRMVPDVLSDQENDEVESFEDNLLGCLQCTRPEVYERFCVPPALLSGDHKKVVQWGREQALPRTRERRPDPFAKVELNRANRRFLQAQAERGASES